MKISRTIFISLISLCIVLGGTYFVFFKESPAAQYLRTSCEAIKSTPILKSTGSNQKLLKTLEFNLNLAKKADEKVTFDLSQYVDELRDYVKVHKANNDAIASKLNFDLALGIIAGRNRSDIVDDAVKELRENSEKSQKELSQKIIGLRNTYIDACSDWIEIE